MVTEDFKLHDALHTAYLIVFQATMDFEFRLVGFPWVVQAALHHLLSSINESVMNFLVTFSVTDPCKSLWAFRTCMRSFSVMRIDMVLFDILPLEVFTANVAYVIGFSDDFLWLELE